MSTPKENHTKIRALCNDCQELLWWDWTEHERRACPLCANSNLYLAHRTPTPPPRLHPTDKPPEEPGEPVELEAPPEFHEAARLLDSEDNRVKKHAINKLVELHQAGYEWTLALVSSSAEFTQATDAVARAAISPWLHHDTTTGTELDESPDGESWGEEMDSLRLDPAVVERAAEDTLWKTAVTWDPEGGRHFLDYYAQALHWRTMDEHREVHGRPVQDITVAEAAEFLNTTEERILERIRAAGDPRPEVICEATMDEETAKAQSPLTHKAWYGWISGKWFAPSMSRGYYLLRPPTQLPRGEWSYKEYTPAEFTPPLQARWKNGEYIISRLTDEEGRGVYPPGRYRPEPAISSPETAAERAEGVPGLDESNIDTEGMSPGMREWLELQWRAGGRVTHAAAAEVLGLSRETTKKYAARLRHTPPDVVTVEGEEVEPLLPWENPDMATKEKFPTGIPDPTPYNAVRRMNDPDWHIRL